MLTVNLTQLSSYIQAWYWLRTEYMKLNIDSVWEEEWIKGMLVILRQQCVWFVSSLSWISWSCILPIRSSSYFSLSFDHIWIIWIWTTCNICLQFYFDWLNPKKHLLWVESWACIWELPITKLPLQIIYNIWLCVKEYYQYCSWIVR